MTAFLRNCINLIKGKQNDCLSSKKQPSMKRDIGTEIGMSTELFKPRPIWHKQHYYENSETKSKSKHSHFNEINGKFLSLLSHSTIK